MKVAHSFLNLSLFASAALVFAGNKVDHTNTKSPKGKATASSFQLCVDTTGETAAFIATLALGPINPSVPPTPVVENTSILTYSFSGAVYDCNTDTTTETPAPLGFLAVTCQGISEDFALDIIPCTGVLSLDTSSSSKKASSSKSKNQGQSTLAFSAWATVDLPEDETAIEDTIVLSNLFNVVVTGSTGVFPKPDYFASFEVSDQIETHDYEFSIGYTKKGWAPY